MRKVSIAVFGFVAGCVSLEGAPARDEARIVDSASARLGGDVPGWVAAVDHSGAYGGLAAGPARSEPLWDWNLRTGASVNGSPAIYGMSFTSKSANDALYFGTTGDGAGSGIPTSTGGADVSAYAPAMADSNFFKLTNLYDAVPTVEWYANVTGGLAATSAVFSKQGNRIYAVSGSGSLYCFPSSAGGGKAPYALPSSAFCPGWRVRSIQPGGGVAYSTPWLDRRTEALYFGDTNGTLFKVNALTGDVVWSKPLGAAIHSSPIEVASVIYVGDDAGYFHRLRDPGTTAPAVDQKARLCTTCGPSSAIYAGPTLDVGYGYVYVTAEGKVFEFPHDASTATPWAQTATSPKDLGTAGGRIMYSSPVLDYGNGFIYTGYANKLWKIAYPFVGNGNSGFYGTALVGSGSDDSYPRSSPLSYESIVYVGNGAGNTEQYGCSTAGLSPSLKAKTATYGTSVDATPLADFASGNVNFGYTSASGGGLVQIAQGGTWGCPDGKISCAIAGCAGACAECCANSDCAAGYNCNNFKCIQNCQNPPDTTCAASRGKGNFSLGLACPAGEKIVGVQYAYFGNPTGSCGAGYVAGSCDDPSAASKVLTACNGKNDCTLDANAFDSGCHGTATLAVRVACSPSAGLICSTNHTTSTTCSGGVCTATCAPGHADCNLDEATDGCETGTTTDTSNCGACNAVCSSNHLPVPTCTAGVCGGTCAAGYADCNGDKLKDGCESAVSCASCCGVACTTGQSCIDGTCQAATTAFTSCVDHVPNGGVATLTCPTGYTISDVAFAGYGQPTGTCTTSSASAPMADAACDAANVQSKIRNLCQNQNTCSFTASSSLFSQNTSCEGALWFSANVTCSASTLTYCP